MTRHLDHLVARDLLTVDERDAIEREWDQAQIDRYDERPICKACQVATAVVDDLCRWCDLDAKEAGL